MSLDTAGDALHYIRGSDMPRHRCGSEMEPIYKNLADKKTLSVWYCNRCNQWAIPTGRERLIKQG